MRIDFLDQQLGLAARFGFGRATALFCQYEQPGDNADDQREREKYFPEYSGELQIIGGNGRGRLQIDQPERQSNQTRGNRKYADIMPEMRIDQGIDRLWQPVAKRFHDVGLKPRMRLAEIVTACIERAAK